MNKFEKILVVFAIVYSVIYGFFFFNIDMMAENSFQRILPFHLFGMALNLGLLVVVIRDIYKRKFTSANSKTTWTLLVILFWPSIFIYLPKYGFKSRDQIITDAGTKKYILGFIVIILCFFGFIAYSASAVPGLP